MPDLRYSRLIDFLTPPRDTMRHGIIEGTIKSATPPLVLLDGVNAAVPVTLACPAFTAADLNKRVLIYELGGAKRYALGVLSA